MRTLIIIKSDHFLYVLHRFVPALQMSHVDPFVLKDTIYPFGNSIFQWIAIFCHTDQNMVFFKFFDIRCRTILNTPIRMMDQTGIFRQCTQNLFQCLECIVRRKITREVPHLNQYIRSILFISNLYKNRTLRFDTIEFP